VDFESTASAYSATSARFLLYQMTLGVVKVLSR